MFERTLARARVAAEKRAERRIEVLAAELAAELPAGIEARAEREGVLLVGRRLGRRFAVEPALRWLRIR